MILWLGFGKILNQILRPLIQIRKTYPYSKLYCLPSKIADSVAEEIVEDYFEGVKTVILWQIGTVIKCVLEHANEDLKHITLNLRRIIFTWDTLIVLLLREYDKIV